MTTHPRRWRRSGTFPRIPPAFLDVVVGHVHLLPPRSPAGVIAAAGAAPRSLGRLNPGSAESWFDGAGAPRADLRHPPPAPRPRSARRVWTAVESADVVIHAGDWVSTDLLDALSARVGAPGRLLGQQRRSRVARSGCPKRADVTLAGVRFTVVHETGVSAGREAGWPRALPGHRCLVFGPVTFRGTPRAANGLRLINPGRRPTGGASPSAPI